MLEKFSQIFIEELMNLKQPEAITEVNTCTVFEMTTDMVIRNTVFWLLL